MVVTCAFYGFVNRPTKVDLQVDEEKLAVGKVFAFEGDSYVILSVFETGRQYHANVVLEHVYRARTFSRPRSPSPILRALDEDGHESDPDDQQDAGLRARLQAMETNLDQLLREREEVLKLVDRAIDQLDRLHQDLGTS